MGILNQIMMKTNTCKCGIEIQFTDISYSNRCNEEGEEYVEYEFECPNCHTIVELSEWGEHCKENEQNVIESIFQSIQKK